MDSKKNIEVELASIAPLLNSIDRSPVQTIPQGYFEQLTMPISATPLVKMKPRTGWIRYAAAAVVLGILVTGAFVYHNQTRPSFEYEQYSKLDIAAEVNQLSDDDLQNYLSTNAVLSGAGQQAIDETSELTIETKLSQISDEEIVKYLNEISTKKS